jgi:hypothetical protein
VTRRRRRGRKHLLDDIKEKRGYWKLKTEALDHTVWRTRFAKGNGPVVKTGYRIMNKRGHVPLKEPRGPRGASL